MSYLKNVFVVDNDGDRLEINPDGSINAQIIDSTNNLIVNVDGSINTKTTIQNSHLDIQQEVVADPNNSSTTNLNSGQTFVGTASSTLGYVGIQVSLKTDSNCTVYIDQSPDGVNWDIVDSFEYIHSLGGDGRTIQAVNSFVRIRVRNDGPNATTYFRLQLALCPIVEALPRTLTSDARLKTDSFLSDHYGFKGELTPMGEMRVSETTKLVGTTFVGTTVDPNFVSVSNTNGGTTTQANANLILATNTTPNGATVAWSIIAGRYSAGNPMRYRAVMQLGDTGVIDNSRRWGIGWGSTMPTISEGAFFQLDGTTFQIVLLKGSVPTIIQNGSFNGQTGDTIEIDTNVHVYEIYWTNYRVWFVYGDKILHTFEASTETWADTMSHYAGMDNVNSNGLNTNQLLYCRVFSISRLGPLRTQPRSKYQSGTTAANIHKYGPGTLHGVIISGVAQNSVITLYDNVAASGTIIWSSGTMGSQTQPFSLEFHDLPFSIGLTLAITGASSNITTVYE